MHTNPRPPGPSHASRGFKIVSARHRKIAGKELQTHTHTKKNILPLDRQRMHVVTWGLEPPQIEPFTRPRPSVGPTAHRKPRLARNRSPEFLPPDWDKYTREEKAGPMLSSLASPTRIPTETVLHHSLMPCLIPPSATRRSQSAALGALNHTCEFPLSQPGSRSPAWLGLVCVLCQGW